MKTNPFSIVRSERMQLTCPKKSLHFSCLTPFGSHVYLLFLSFQKLFVRFKISLEKIG